MPSCRHSGLSTRDSIPRRYICSLIGWRSPEGKTNPLPRSPASLAGGWFATCNYTCGRLLRSAAATSAQSSKNLEAPCHKVVLANGCFPSVVTTIRLCEPRESNVTSHNGAAVCPRNVTRFPYNQKIPQATLRVDQSLGSAARYNSTRRVVFWNVC